MIPILLAAHLTLCEAPTHHDSYRPLQQRVAPEQSADVQQRLREIQAQINMLHDKVRAQEPIQRPMMGSSQGE